MLKRTRRIFSLVLTLVLLITAFPATTLEAAKDITPEWVQINSESYMLSGTDIVATISGSRLTFTGNGRLPDYTLRTYRKRPWSGKIITKIDIPKTITYIGTYEFYNVKCLKDVEVYLSTYVGDRSSFQDLVGVRYRIKGTDYSTVYYGTLPFTSLNSYEFMAYNRQVDNCYIFDNELLAVTFQNSCSPTIENVFVSTDELEPWLHLSAYRNGFKSTNIVKIADATPMKNGKVTTKQFFPTQEVYNAFANNIGDYQYAFAFDVAVTRLDTYDMSSTLYYYQYVLEIPAAYQVPGKSYKLMQLTTTGIKILDDCDMNDNTLTFITNYPATTYALIYK